MKILNLKKEPFENLNSLYKEEKKISMILPFNLTTITSFGFVVFQIISFYLNTLITEESQINEIKLDKI